LISFVRARSIDPIGGVSMPNVDGEENYVRHQAFAHPQWLRVGLQARRPGSAARACPGARRRCSRRSRRDRRSLKTLFGRIKTWNERRARTSSSKVSTTAPGRHRPAREIAQVADGHYVRNQDGYTFVAKPAQPANAVAHQAKAAEQGAPSLN